MNWQTYSLFLFSTFFVSAAPGSNMLYAFQIGLNYGLRKTLWVMAGLSAGLGLLLIAALLGLGVLAKYPLLLTLIKLVGAVYLIYLGAVSWQGAQKLEGQTQRVVPKRGELFRSGVWVSLSNPKAILFFAAFFPKFIDFSAPLTMQYVLLVGGFFVIETLWQLIYAGGGIQLSAWLNQGRRMLYLNRACGLVFVAIGLMLIYESVVA